MIPDFIEIGTQDTEAAKSFFADVMGWSWVEMEKGRGGYFTDGTRKVGLHQEETLCMVPYLTVNDIESAVARVKAAGGSVMGDIADGAELGRFATCADPQGMRFGLHEET